MSVTNIFYKSHFVLYKYAWEKNFSTVFFTGEHINANDLRNLILNTEEKQQRLSMKVQRRNRDYLELYRADYEDQSGEPISNDEFVSSDTRVIIKRTSKSIFNSMPEYLSTIFANYGINLVDYEQIEPTFQETTFLLIRPNDLSLLNKMIISKTYYVKLNWFQPYLHSKNIILIFATHGQGRFQGYAKVTNISFTQTGQVRLNLEWLRINEVHFAIVNKELKSTSTISNASLSKLPNEEASQICALFETSFNWYDFTVVPQRTVMAPPIPRVKTELDDETKSTGVSSSESNVSTGSKLNTTFLTKDFTDFSVDEKTEETQIKFISSRDPRKKVYQAKMRTEERSRSRSKSPSQEFRF